MWQFAYGRDAIRRPYYFLLGQKNPHSSLS